MAPILISWASAEPPSNAAASTPKHSFAVADLIKSSPGDQFFLGSSVRRAVQACQWRHAAAACLDFVQDHQMTNVFAAGGYRYIPAVFQYSGGVAAEPGFAIVRVRFHRPVPLAEGFARVEQAIREAGRPLTAFCACELRSPAPFTEDGFRAFNEIYAGTLRKWDVMQGDTNPVARSNVCPEIDPPPEPSFYAFCFTVAATGPIPTFVVAGSGEAVEGKGNYRDHT